MKRDTLFAHPPRLFIGLSLKDRAELREWGRLAIAFALGLALSVVVVSSLVI